MRRKHLHPLVAVAPGAVVAILALGALPARAVPVVPTNFVVDDAAPGAAFNTPVGIAFLPDGRMFVAEKRGRVYEVRNGVKQPNPLWAGENEVLNNGDRGLLCVAVDPDYYRTHWIYLLYTVDPDSDGVDTNAGAFGRLTRYTVNFADSASVIPSSRTILMGASWSTAPLSASTSHTIGSLRWGRDSSLIVSVGDGAQFDLMDAGGHDPADFGPGLTDPFEDIGSFRSLYLGSLAGKILRLERHTGHGLASNPFVDGDLTSPRSRVWCYGVRNAYRFNLRPGTGSADTSAANPGTLYLGDVGWNTWEELDVAPTGGLNFGWPCYEGPGPQADYQAGSPAHNGCDSFGTPSNPVPATGPLSTWNHDNDAISIPPGFHGNTSIGGVFYTANVYPSQFRGQYFFGDYGQSWIKCAVVDGNDHLIQILDFGTNMDGPVDFATNPTTGDVYYVAINTSQVRRIRWTGPIGGNTQPVASIVATPLSGSAPLAVSFSAAGSIDADNDPLTYAWLFGDGGSASGVTTSHTYSAAGVYSAQVTVSDGRGGVDVRTAVITVTPPGSTFPSTGILDDFNRANGPIGGLWVDNTAGLVIVNQALAQNPGTNSTVWNGASFGANEEAYVTFLSTTPNAPEQNLMLKVQGTSWSTGHIEVAYDAASFQIAVNTYAPSQSWVNRGTIGPVVFNGGDQFGASADSAGDVIVYRNGVQLGLVSVGDWPFAANGGRLGMTLTDASSSVFDNFGGGNTVRNTPPSAAILSPSQDSFYNDDVTIDLTGSATDAQTPSDGLTYKWIVDIHHKTYVAAAAYEFNGKTATLAAQDYDDGFGVHLEIKLAVTDPGGLSDTARVTIWPEIDLEPSSVTVVPNPAFATQSARYSFVLHNRGAMPAPYSHWVLRAGAELLAEGDTIVAGNDSLSMMAEAVVPAVGTYALRLTVDSLDTVHETVETNNAWVGPLQVVPPGTDVGEIRVTVLRVSQPFPNPSRGQVTLALETPGEARVGWQVFDLQGRCVWSDGPRRLAAGRWNLSWNGRSSSGDPAAAGLYLARVSVDGRMFLRRLALVR